jgi:hypothetical protein
MQPPASHPDPDVLAAFAERSLPERERIGVLDHLAACRDCRDVVALALPTTEAVQTTVAPVRRGWLSWPALRWGLVAAGIVAIGSFAIVQYEHSLRPIATNARVALPDASTQARNEITAPASPVAQNQDKAAVSHSARLTASGSEKVTEAGRKSTDQTAQTQPSAQIVRPSNQPVLGFFAGGPRAAQQQSAVQQQHPAPVPAAPQAFAKQRSTANYNSQPQSTRDLVVNGQAFEVETQAQNVSNDQGAASQKVQYDNYVGGPIGKAKPAETAQISVAAPLVSVEGRSLQPLIQVQTGPALWSVSSSGVLQRSVDQGATWQEVNVFAAPAVTGANFVALDVSAETARLKEAQADKKSAKGPAPSFIFRAVIANGIEVWAGGFPSILYHSIDSGNHWMRAVPSSGGTFLTGDIVKLEFPDSQHGKVTTSTSEVWTTSDDGQTWQKQ